ncbi:MAG: DNA replication and repair protein RecF [Oscillospiraceae bacterium]|jgi:DNA replication and repair protein RecF|nr:DNA replication and repair protein RecF [Oscillospiraceae bacterium]
MRLQTLEVINFRNIEYAKLTEFDAAMNVICGNNAQGKTNLIEAIYFACTGKGFRTRDDTLLVHRGSERAYVTAGLVTGNPEGAVGVRSQTVTVSVGAESKKRIELNGSKLKTMGSLPFRVVLFTPEDLDLSKGGAATRRHWLDQVISQLRPKYAETLTEYRKLYDNKLKLLREYRPSSRSTLEAYNVSLAKAGAILIHYRAMFCEKLAPFAAESHRIITTSNEKLHVTYKTVAGIGNASKMKPSEICVKLLEHQNTKVTAEINSGSCISGAHKDDILLDIDGMESDYWSQGQARTVTLSLKFAEREFIREDCNEYPIMLFDDVLSELDFLRRHIVLKRAGAGQTFVTMTDIAEFHRNKIKGMAIPMRGGSAALV